MGESTERYGMECLMYNVLYNLFNVHSCLLYPV